MRTNPEPGPISWACATRPILAVLAFTAARVGAVAKLTFKSLRHDGTQYALRFAEKGGKSREIPVRADLQKILLAYVQAAGIADGPLFRTAAGKTGNLTANAMTGIDICRMMKRRLKAAGPAHRLFAALFPRHDHHRPARAKHGAGRRAVPRRPRRPAHHPPLRPQAAQGHAQHRRAHLDQHRAALIPLLTPQVSRKSPGLRMQFHCCPR